MRLIVLLAVVALVGCGVQYRNDAEQFLQTQPPEAWGEPPTKDARIAAEENWLTTRLKDPYSAKIGYSEDAQRGTIAKTMFDPTVVPIWFSYVSVNAKNSFGAYTGAQTYTFFYQGKFLFAVDSPTDGRSYLEQPADIGAIENAQQIIKDHSGPDSSATLAPSSTSAPSPAAAPGKNEFKVGQLAKSLGCSTPKLLNSTASAETYQAQCPDGQYKLISCKFTNCRVMQ